jgi:ABC-type uncharacterized transport system substrate-binding protein
MAVSSYPDKIGLVKTLARPGVTGLSHVAPELHAKKLELLREVARNASPVAVLCNPTCPVEHLGFSELSGAIASAGMLLHSIDVRTSVPSEAGSRACSRSDCSSRPAA